ncbi:MAG: polyprenol monophosphomannose synthase [Bacteroidetes bacterium]|nr:polyprenol monophosphomannose synthase [Bacteroidota bacterium]MCH8170347.1 polyprenol monophosphomannose synthase [Bacteroidota bacterium]MCH8941341.1 polyprenol monophosphomannose synthase [Bacteroidota bacterium]
MSEKSLIIIPTYNELANVPKLVPEILSRYEKYDLDVLVVDDNSPDGTSKYIKELMQTTDRVKLITRKAKLGLGTAYIEGFKFALKNQYDFIFEMDADFSHDPKEIKNFLKEIKTCDLVLGSRYKKGVNVVNWPMKRLLLSYFANGYSRYITGLKICDATSGFKCFRREVIEAIDLDKVKSNGYAFQIEMTFKAWKKGYKICEIPIIFIDRTEGHSKMSKKIVHEAIFMVWKLRIRSIFGRL